MRRPWVFLVFLRRHKNLKIDESMKVVFGADKASLIRFINSAFGKDYDPDKAAFRTHPTEYVNSDYRRVYSNLVAYANRS